MPNKSQRLAPVFSSAKEQYAEYGVDVDTALATLKRIPVSLQCWQGDDVGGFEVGSASPGGGMAVTGNYPGKARNAEELRSDLDLAFSLIPGRHRLSLHSTYGETSGRSIERNELEPDHFRNWIVWARQRERGLDFNQTFFSHPKAADGFTLSHRNRAIRNFWIEHGIVCREIGSAIGRSLKNPCITNVWIPDGYKDTPADREGPRQRLLESLDRIFEKPLRWNLDSVESKLFGIGSESYVVGSHEFYLGYAMTRKTLLTLDSGHYHPTETLADKVSSILQFIPELLLHVSRGVRWDSDHVVTLTDDLQATSREIVANGYLDRVHLGLDYFDASINRVAAWVIGTRSLLYSLLMALLEPPAIRAAELAADFTARLALQEAAKSLPVSAVWSHYCDREGVPPAAQWLAEVRRYEKDVLLKRV